MNKIMTSAEFCEKALNICNNHNTVYMWGSFGQKVTNGFISSKAKDYPNYYTAARINRFKKMTNVLTWAFDCVGLIKGILWGWVGNVNFQRGGVTYPTESQIATGAVPDTSADGMIGKCNNVSSDFTKIEAGEMVWISGHVGIYVGNGLVVEATDKWERKVLLSRIPSIKSTRTDVKHTRKWSKHGKLPWVDYSNKKEPEKEVETDMEYYETINEVPAGEMREVVEKLVQHGTIKGNGKGLHLSEDNVRLLVFLNREGLFR